MKILLLIAVGLAVAWLFFRLPRLIYGPPGRGTPDAGVREPREPKPLVGIGTNAEPRPRDDEFDRL